MSKDSPARKRRKNDTVGKSQSRPDGDASRVEYSGLDDNPANLPDASMTPANLQTTESVAASSAASSRSSARLKSESKPKAVPFIPSIERHVQNPYDQQFWYYQAAGKTGSRAGDAALVSLGDTLLVIDAGMDTLTTQWPKIKKLSTHKNKILVITHWHSDHATFENDFVSKLKSRGDLGDATLPDWWSKDEKSSPRADREDEQAAAASSSSQISASRGKSGQTHKSDPSELALITCSRAPEEDRCNKFHKPAIAHADWRKDGIWNERIGGWFPDEKDDDHGCELFYSSRTSDDVQIDIGIFDPRLPGEPSNENDTSLGLLVIVGEWSLLTLGDMNIAGQKKMHAWMPKKLSPTVIKLAHHGSRDNIYLPLLRFYQKPQLLISSGHTGEWQNKGEFLTGTVSPLAKSLAVLMQKTEFENDTKGGSFLNGFAGVSFAELGSTRALHHDGKLISLKQYALDKATQELNAQAASSSSSSISFQDSDEEMASMPDAPKAIASRQNKSSTRLPPPPERGAKSRRNQAGRATPASAATSSSSGTKPGTGASTPATKGKGKRSRDEGDSG